VGMLSRREQGQGCMSGHSVVLLGDSILDNWPYTRPAPDTTALLEARLGSAWSVERLAQDGATLSGLPYQLAQLRRRHTWAVVSIGGNDLSAHVGLLGRQATSSAELLGELLRIADDFSRRYETAAQAVAERAERVLLCTVYEVPLEPPIYAELARAPLGLFNDRIVRAGARLGVDVLDLRSVCTEKGDFVLQIEPSPRGAAKIAEAIARVLDGPSSIRSARVFAA
jgi:lysophospholipase L1-like esterase